MQAVGALASGQRAGHAGETSFAVSITILAFAQARDTFGFSSRCVACTPDDTPRTILQQVAPAVALDHLRVALDHEYSTWDTPVGAARELAIIPPVSGG